MATTITGASVVTSLWQRHYMFFFGRVSWRIFQKKIFMKYEELVRCLQSSFPSQEYTDLLEGSSFRAMVKRYDAFIQARSNDVTFAFWTSYLEIVEDLLLFIRATRDRDWSLHLASVHALLRWMFAYDRTNYSRYLPVYWFDMNNLPTTHPFVHQELERGNFTVQKGKNCMASRLLDHRKILSYCLGQFPLSLATNEGFLV